MSQTLLPRAGEPGVDHGGHQTCLGCTQRHDSWWAGPTATVLGLVLFTIYATWAAFQGQHYYSDPYLSPFYSPLLLVNPAVANNGVAHAWFPQAGWPDWLPSFVTPAFFILIFPGSFRGTCYYYRKAYYRSFMASPPGCAVGGVQYDYQGERRLLLFQNLHRYALYFALIFIGILYYDAFVALRKEGQWGIGVGTIVLFLNATFLGGFTFGCNSFRHLVGGGLNWYSKHPLRHAIWRGVSVLNARHMQLAWISLFWVGLTDLYVRLVSMGVITDLNTWH